MLTMMRLLLLLLLSTIRAFQTTTYIQQRPRYADIDDWWRLKEDVQSSSTDTTIVISADKPIDFTDLMVMDVVLFQQRTTDNNNPPSLQLGAVQENGNIAIAPLSTWTLESAYTSTINDMMEFVVDEEDLFPGMTADEVQVLTVLNGDVVGYGSRQVGGGKGPGNPHGEESEIIYYVDRSVVEGVYAMEGCGDDEVMKIDVVVSEGLEHLW